MIIRGQNLGDEEAEYRLLSEHPFFDDGRQAIVKKLERFYLDILAESETSAIQLFPREGDKVAIMPGMLNHRCSNNIDSLRAISQYGILASEWFGILESEGEGRFCAFVDRIHSEQESDNSFLNGKKLNTQRLKTKWGDIILFVDSTNSIMQKLLHLDFFEYIKIKQLSPERITQLYTSEEIEIFDEIIEPFSLGGRDFHMNNFLPYCDWSAIPGGIPSTLINGICTKGMTYADDYLDELAQLFPNATIFNGELEILRSPTKEMSAQKHEEQGGIVPQINGQTVGKALQSELISGEIASTEKTIRGHLKRMLEKLFGGKTK